MLSTLAPAAGTALETKPVMTMSLWCTCYAIIIILYRVAGRWYRTKTYFSEDIILLSSIPILITRIILVARILYNGTNNVDLSSLSELDIQRREFGSKLVLVTRMLHAMYLWVVKLSMGIYLTRLIDQFWAAKAILSNSSGGRIIKTFLSRYANCMIYMSLGLSFVGVLISEMVECRPFTHYWQVVPDPGTSCRQSYGQLFTMGGLNILTDLILIALPLPLIMEAKLARKAKFESFMLMLFPLVNIVFTAYRLPKTVSFQHRGSQQYRTLMASLDILLATASANALVVTSFLLGRGFKKQHYKHPILDGPDENAMEEEQRIEGGRGLELKTLGPTAGLHLPARNIGDRRSQATKQHWASYEDLMRDDTGFAVGESPTQSVVSKRMSTLMRDSNDTEGAAVDDCSIRSTSRLSPYPKTETNISAAKLALSRAEPGDAVVEIAVPPKLRRTSTVKGIVVETTWQVDVSSSSRAPVDSNRVQNQ